MSAEQPTVPTSRTCPHCGSWLSVHLRPDHKYICQSCKHLWDSEFVGLEALRARLQTAEQQLGNLLARIHRDGGHYQDEHGTEKSVHDAEIIIARLLVCEEEKSSAEQQLGQVREEIGNFIVQLRAGERHCRDSKDSVGIATGSALKTIADQLEMMIESPATPSDGCGKGRTDKEPDCVCRDCGHVHFWSQRIVTDGGTFCPKPRCFSAQYNKRIVAASSSGEEGGR